MIRARRRAASRAPRSLRGVAAVVVWAGCSAVALVVAVAALGRALQADVGAAPWRWLFRFAEAVSPAADEFLRGEGVVGATARDMITWGASALGWLVIGLVATLILRPRPVRGASD